MTPVMTIVMPNIVMRSVVDVADVGIPMVVPIVVMVVVMMTAAMVVAVAHIAYRRAPVVMRVTVFHRALVAGSSRRSWSRLAEARRHGEQDRPEDQSRHNIYPSFHIGHRLSFSNFIVGRQH